MAYRAPHFCMFSILFPVLFNAHKHASMVKSFLPDVDATIKKYKVFTGHELYGLYTSYKCMQTVEA